MCGLLFSADTSLDVAIFEQSLARISHRGPDDSKVMTTEVGLLGFNRLAIMDLSSRANQPFRYENTYLVCNGEIFNSSELRSEFSEETFFSKSDCEVILPLVAKYGLAKTLEKLDGEFSFVLVDTGKSTITAARDPLGVRPLFFGYSKTGGGISFASEAKALHGFCSDIAPFPPGCLYIQGEFESYLDLRTSWSDIAPTSANSRSELDSLDKITTGIRKQLTSSVLKRLSSDAPLGFLLSGGLDSSLVCAIAQQHLNYSIRTFAVGMETDAIDLGYARDVAKYLGTNHTEIVITNDDAMACIRDVIFHLESFDITTVRASIGMYLICRNISASTDIKVLLTGEVSDELFGYKYTDFAPTSSEFQKEAAKRVGELHKYDILRADRCLSAHSIEARVPFGDKAFVELVMGVDPKFKMNTYGQGKYLLRKAFEGDLLPDSILYREKAAFSDAVGHSLVDKVKSSCELMYTDEEFSQCAQKYSHVKPFTKESLFYREVFESLFSGLELLIPGFWMPNQSWENCDVQDPSARVLPNYGTSGS